MKKIFKRIILANLIFLSYVNIVFAQGSQADLTEASLPSSDMWTIFYSILSIIAIPNMLIIVVIFILIIIFGIRYILVGNKLDEINHKKAEKYLKIIKWSLAIGALLIVLELYIMWSFRLPIPY